MGGKPKTIYSDNEGAFVSNEIHTYFANEHIRHVTTLGHAPVAERQLRTIKDMIYKRIENTNKDWWEVLYPVLLAYTNKLVHNVTKHTPEEALKQSNQSIVKCNLELKKEATDDTQTLESAMQSEFSNKKK